MNRRQMIAAGAAAFSTPAIGLTAVEVPLASIWGEVQRLKTLLEAPGRDIEGDEWNADYEHLIHLQSQIAATSPSSHEDWAIKILNGDDGGMFECNIFASALVADARRLARKAAS